MNKAEFLERSDVNILDYDVSDTIDLNGNSSIVVLLSVDKLEEEVMLTKENLQHLLAVIEDAEKNGVDYSDETDED